MPSNKEIFSVLLEIADKDKMDIPVKDIYDISQKCERKLHVAVWYLQLKSQDLHYIPTYRKYLANIVNLMFSVKSSISKHQIKTKIIQIRKDLYTLFITNLDVQFIMRELMKLIVSKLKKIEHKYQIVEVTSEYEMRLSLGKRYIIHLEAYVNKVIYLLNQWRKG